MHLWHQKPRPGQLPGGVISGVDQVCFVVHDLDRALDGMTRLLGVGPFKVWTLAAPTLFDTTLADQPTPWSMRLGVALVGGVQWEVIQPLTGATSHREHLETRYEGLHHLLVENRGHSFEAARDTLAALGHPLVQTARLNLPLQLGPLTVPAAPELLATKLSTYLGYTDTHATLGTTLELARFPPGVSRPLGVRIGKPDAWRPADASNITARLDNGVLDRVVKLGFISADAEASVRAWLRVGVGPWLFAELGAADLGTISVAAGSRIRVGWCLLGSTLLEIVEPVAGDTPHGRWLAESGPGLHVLGVKSDTLALPELLAFLRARGLPVLLEGVLHGGFEFAVIDAREACAGLLELVQLDAEPLWAELQRLPGVRWINP